MSLFGQMKGWVCALFLAASPVMGQEFSGLARLDAAQSEVRDIWGGLEVALYLSQPVPWRVFTLDEPRRLVLDFREVDWGETRAPDLLDTGRAIDLRVGGLRPGWSRMVVELSEPLVLETAEMAVNESDGTAHLVVRLAKTSAGVFSELSGAPEEDPAWTFEAAAPSPEPGGAPQDLVVVIDPGHGGIDPGATYEGVSESDVVLVLGYELTLALQRIPGVSAYLTRANDHFVPLQERMSLARSVQADLFISLHADALAGEQATGASIYTLAEDAVGEASQRMAERHERGDLLAGVDLSGQDDEVATILMDLARLETGPAADRFAGHLVQAFHDLGVPLAGRPRREALLAVLTSADFPAVLVELGFLSNAQDRARLTSARGRAMLIDGITAAVGRWMLEEEALAPLIRQ